MKFMAKASSEEGFSTWVQSVKQSAKNLSADEYQLLMNPTEYDPVSYYATVQEGLFDQIIIKYMHP
jgi:cytochrome o ubiquinol oxidase subunit 2